MHLTLFVVFFTGLLLVTGQSIARQATELSSVKVTGNKSKPNIVYILADDMGYGDTSYAGGKAVTPAIDSLANEGMNFTDAHAASAVCTPTRYGILTGRYPWRSRMQSGVMVTKKHPQADGSVKTGDETLITPNQLTVAKLLQQNGYNTAMVGKWHLGIWYNMPNGQDMDINKKLTNAAPIGTQITGGPVERGFDEYWGFHYAREMRTWIEHDTVTEVLSHPRKMLPKLADAAAAYIDKQTANQPFFLYVALSAPHTPITPNKKWLGQSNINIYADFLMETDHAVQKIMIALAKNPAINDNTLVIFTADNGASHQADFKTLLKYNHDSSGGLRGSKSDLYEGGHRVPFIVKWPGVVPAKSNSDELISLNSFLATTADLLNQQIPEDQAPDSFSIMPILRGESAKGEIAYPTHPLIIMASLKGFLAIRQGDWKLIAHKNSGGWGKGEDEYRGWKIDFSQPVQLYNMADDRKEQVNLAATMPDKTRQMVQLLLTAINNGRTTQGKTLTNDSNMRKWRAGVNLPD